MKLEFMPRDKIIDLKSNFHNCKIHYMKNDKQWFDETILKDNGLRASKIECEAFELDMTSTDYGISDLNNIKIMYNALKDVLPLDIASDERLWTGLAHGYLWDYVQYRRQKELAAGDDKKIKSSYFYTNGNRRSTVVNCIARLWWAGYFTYDKTNKNNPYEITDYIFSWAFPSNIMLLESSHLTANKRLCLGVLRSLKKRHANGEETKRDHLVESLKYLNEMGSVTLLDTLDNRDIESIVDNFLNKRFGVL